MEVIQGGVTAPRGFLAGAARCGLKKEGYDLGIILSERPAQAAAMFTTNQIVAAPIVLSREAIKRGEMRAVVVNSGNANACTGERGYENARTMAEVAASSLGISPDEVFVASTGIIGEQLPMEKIASGKKAPPKALRPEIQSGHA